MPHKGMRIPETAHAALERSDGIDKSMPTDHVAEEQPYSDRTHDGHPALKHLKQAESVHHVFGHPTGKKY